MRSLIRFVSRNPSGASESRDKIHDGEALTLGRATDQVLHLKDRRVALEHARIVKRGDSVVLSAQAAVGVTVNGALLRETRLLPGDVVEIGANLLKLSTPPAGFDLAFTFELATSAATDEGAAPPRKLRLSETALAKRWPAWTLTAAVLLVCLLLPASGLLSHSWQQSLRRSLLPDDHWWASGPLAMVHGNLEGQCDRCHQRAFQRVPDAACLTCHGGRLHGHVALRGARIDLDERRCASCHAEHNEPPLLVRRDNALCAGCHVDIRATVGRDFKPAIGNASDFLFDHPPFPTASVKNSGVKFSHAVHLAAAGVKSPTGRRVLGCADCHEPEPGGARMQPIRMERHCVECHRLDFDPADPERQVPHGNAEAALTLLIEYYSAKYLEGYPDPLARAVPGIELRRPGAELSRQEREATLRRAREKAFTVARDLFERRTCATCHTVERRTDAATGLTWSVAPAAIAAVWMPNARFDHARHGTALTRCETCHDAKHSHQAADVLMPRIGVCRTCHAGAHPPGDRPTLIASGCASCHSFHRATEPLWRAAEVSGSIAR